MSTLLDELSLHNPPKIGIIGGGQIGKMIAQEAKRMSLKVVILDPNKNCPASTICDKLIVANLKALEKLESKNYPIFPSPHSLYLIQNKFRQKQFLQENNLPVPEFKKITSINDLLLVAKSFQYPLMLKACEDSYDGRGNYL